MGRGREKRELFIIYEDWTLVSEDIKKKEKKKKKEREDEAPVGTHETVEYERFPPSHYRAHGLFPVFLFYFLHSLFYIIFFFLSPFPTQIYSGFFQFSLAAFIYFSLTFVLRGRLIVSLFFRFYSAQPFL